MSFSSRLGAGDRVKYENNEGCNSPGIPLSSMLKPLSRKPKVRPPRLGQPSVRDAVINQLAPYFLQAIRVHPRPVAVRIIRGNPVTVRDYARWMIRQIKEKGLGNISAEKFKSLTPPIRCYFYAQGIVLAGFKINLGHGCVWTTYKTPFFLEPGCEVYRWTSQARTNDPVAIKTLVNLQLAQILPAPIELQTSLSLEQIQPLAKGVQVFRFGRNLILWPYPDPDTYDKRRTNRWHIPKPDRPFHLASGESMEGGSRDPRPGADGKRPGESPDCALRS